MAFTIDQFVSFVADAFSMTTQEQVNILQGRTVNNASVQVTVPIVIFFAYTRIAQLFRIASKIINSAAIVLAPVLLVVPEKALLAPTSSRIVWVGREGVNGLIAIGCAYKLRH